MYVPCKTNGIANGFIFLEFNISFLIKSRTTNFHVSFAVEYMFVFLCCIKVSISKKLFLFPLYLLKIMAFSTNLCDKISENIFTTSRALDTREYLMIIEG